MSEPVGPLAEETKQAPSSVPAPKPASAKAPTLAFALGGLVTLLCGAGLAVPLAADSIATSLAARHLEAHGLTCANLSLDVSYDLSRAVVGPTRCTRTEGDVLEVEALELVDSAAIDLVLFEPTHVTMGRVRVHLRADDPGTGVDLGALGPIAAMLHIPARIGSATHAAAEVARHGLPPAEITAAEIVRGEAVRVSMTDLTIGGGAPMSFTIGRMDLPALDGPFGTSASVSMNDVLGDATTATCNVRGELQIDASVPLVGDIHRRPTVIIAATGLDTDRPDWAISIADEP